MTTAGRGFTLLELAVATALLALAAAMVSLNMSGVSETEAMQAGALRLRTLYRLAQVEAARSGRPCSLTCDPDSCVLMRLVFERDGWGWARGPRARMPSGIRIVAVNGGARSAQTVSWSLPVSPGGWHSPVRVTLRGRSEAAMMARIDMGITSFRVDTGH